MSAGVAHKRTRDDAGVKTGSPSGPVDRIGSPPDFSTSGSAACRKAADRERTRDVVAGMDERLEDIGADWRFSRPSPDHRKQLGERAQVLELVDLSNLMVHARPRRRPAKSDAPCTASAATIADPKANAMPFGSSNARTRKNHANANNPSSKPRRTPTAGPGPWRRCANTASTVP